MTRRGTLTISLLYEVAGKTRRRATLGMSRRLSTMVGTGDGRRKSSMAAGRKSSKGRKSTMRKSFLGQRGHSIFGALIREHREEEEQKARLGELNKEYNAAHGGAPAAAEVVDAAELAHKSPYDTVLDRIAKQRCVSCARAPPPLPPPPPNRAVARAHHRSQAPLLRHVCQRPICATPRRVRVCVCARARGRSEEEKMRAAAAAEEKSKKLEVKRRATRGWNLDQDDGSSLLDVGPSASKAEKDVLTAPAEKDQLNC